MKKIILGLSVVFSTLISAQYYPNNGWGNDDSGYTYQDDENYYFPDDYYYEYPNDYYEDGYYQNFYNDYRNSISMINWSQFFVEFNLSRPQINLIIDLNRQFSSFNVWNSYYRMNPKRWWYDRFYALERILGPRVFVVFQNRYYHGYSPVAYYNNYWYDYYRPRFFVMPHYRNVNINFYRVNRYDYHRNVGHKFGWNQPRNSYNNGGFRENNGRRETFKNPQNNNGFRNNDNGGFRKQGNNGMRNDSRGSSNDMQTPRNNGFRNPNAINSPRNENPRSIKSESPNGTRGFGNQTQRNQENNRFQSPRVNRENSSEGSFRNNSNSQRNASPRMEGGQRNSGSERNGGLRTRMQ